MKILHVIPRYPPAIGGVEAWCAGLAHWQARHGHTVRVLTLRVVGEDELWQGPNPPRPAPVAVGCEDIEDGISIRRCGFLPARFAVAHALSRLGLQAFAWGHSPELYGRVLREARTADVVHAHWAPGLHAIVARIAASAARCHFVLTPHFHAGDEQHEHRSVRWLLRHSDRVVTVTAAEGETLAARGVPRARLVPAANAIDPDALAVRSADARAVRAALDVSDGTPLLCYLGRKSPAKSLDVLLAALPLVRHVPPPVLVLAGPSTERWERILCDASCPDRVRDLPALPVPAKAALLAASDVVVQPSRREAFGIVFLEAWAAGAPVVGADIAAVREVVDAAGALFRPDDAADLARAIDDVLDSPARALLIERGRSRIQARYTWARVAPAVMAAYPNGGPSGVAVPAADQPACP